LTRALTIMALIGLLVVGAAAASILGRADMVASRPGLAPPVVQAMVANRQGKADKLPVAGFAPAPVASPQAVAPLNEPLPPQKSYALLSDVQIAGIKERLKLSSSQEAYWPAVEGALRAVARKIHETRQANPRATGAPIDPDCAEVQQLKSAAMPLLFQLREDQKREVRTLAHLIGLDEVASQI